MTTTILILNGPNLNMLGRREPDIYGNETLDNIKQQCIQHAEKLGLDVEFRQSNDEAELIGWIQQADSSFSGIIFNAGAFTHTSVALMDALKTQHIPIIEVHLSNIFQRESFRHTSYIAMAATGGIFGFGGRSYLLALDAIKPLLNS